MNAIQTIFQRVHDKVPPLRFVIPFLLLTYVVILIFYHQEEPDTEARPALQLILQILVFVGLAIIFYTFYHPQ